MLSSRKPNPPYIPTTPMLNTHKYISILIGYLLSYASYMPSILRFRRKRKQSPGSVAPEARLWWLLFLAPLETLGMLGFAWTSLGPSYGIPWIAPMIFSTLVAMANARPPFFSRPGIRLANMMTPVRNLPVFNRLPNRRLRPLCRLRNRRERSRP